MTVFKIPQPEEIVNRLRKLINRQESSEFNQRDTGLKLQTFLQAFTISICFMATVTLEGLAIKCQELQYGLRLTKQALHKRLKIGKNELKTLLSETIRYATSHTVEKPNTAAALEQFAAVYITDATTISLPDKLAEYHEGLGGTNSNSAMKIQATYDIKRKTFKKIDQRDSARENDATYMEELIKGIQKDELLITDLGYYGVKHFKNIDDNGAYFISKIKSNTKLYTENDRQIDIARKLRGKKFIDEMATIKGDAGKTIISVRLCGIKLPSPVYAERIRKARNSGKILKKEELERLKWILIITNITSDMLDSNSICELYRIRWQIELIFKSWKSYFAIDKMNNIGKDYWDCLLYGKLIVITMLTILHSQYNNWAIDMHGRGISYLRFMKNMRENLDIILDYLTFKISYEEMSVIINRIIRASFLERRKRKSSEQIISEFDVPHDRFSCISDFAKTG